MVVSFKITTTRDQWHFVAWLLPLSPHGLGSSTRSGLCPRLCIGCRSADGLLGTPDDKHVGTSAITKLVLDERRGRSVPADSFFQRKHPVDRQSVDQPKYVTALAASESAFKSASYTGFCPPSMTLPKVKAEQCP